MDADSRRDGQRHRDPALGHSGYSWGRLHLGLGSPGISQRALASLDPQTAALQPWAVHPSFQIFDLLADGAQVFGVGGGSGGHAISFDAATGQQQWLGFADGDAVSVTLVNGTVYVGGHFSKWEGEPASHAVALTA